MSDNQVTKNHNQRLKAALQEIQERVSSATSDHDLVAAINLLKGFPSPVRYDNRTVHYICIPFLILSIAAAYFGSQEPELEVMLFAGGITGGLTFIIYLWILFSRRSSLSELSDQIHTKTILFDNGLTNIKAGGRLAAKRLGQEFYDFQRGNHSREIMQTIKGHYHGSEHDFEYRYHRFHYVDRRTETYVTTVNGKSQVKTRTVYDHYDRYSFIIPFPFARNLYILQNRNRHPGVFWETASLDFNKKFGVYADTEQSAAKFLTPKIIIELEKLDTIHLSINLEFSNQGNLCLSFTDGDTMRASRTNGLDDPAAFAEEIGGHTNLHKLDTTLEIVHTLMKYSDNNFS